MKTRKFTIQLTVQEAETIEQFLRYPSHQKPWIQMADIFATRAKRWVTILKKENNFEEIKLK